MQAVSEPGALNCYTFFRSILLTLSVSRNLILTNLLLSRSLNSLLCVLIAPTPDPAFFLDDRHASGGVTMFVRQGLFLSELSTFSLFSLYPYFDYVGVNISLNNFLSLSFLNVYAPHIRSSPTNGRTDSFSPSILSPPEISSFWKTSIAITPSGIQKVLPTPAGRKYSTGSSVLTSSLSITLTYLLFSIAPLAVAPPLTFLLLSPLLTFLAPGSWFRTWVLIIYQFFYLSLFLRSFALRSVLLLSILKKLVGMALPLTLTPTVLLQRNICLFLFPLLLLSSLLWH